MAEILDALELADVVEELAGDTAFVAAEFVEGVGVQDPSARFVQPKPPWISESPARILKSPTGRRGWFRVIYGENAAPNMGNRRRPNLQFSR